MHSSAGYALSALSVPSATCVSALMHCASRSWSAPCASCLLRFLNARPALFMNLLRALSIRCCTRLPCVSRTLQRSARDMCMPAPCAIFLTWNYKLMKQITIGTRASKLAMTQTHEVIKRLLQQWPDLKITVEQISTKGDHVTDVPLTQLGGDGIFVTEIESALRDGRIDLAVHSLKDLPTTPAGGLCIVVTGPREDVRDVIVWNDSIWQEMRRERDGSGQEHYLPPGSIFLTDLRLGTCSLRRMAQIRALMPGAEILPLRGNVDTRLRKLDAGDYDGIVLAAAGLHRLGVHERLADRLRYLPIEVMMPAPGQGALAVEVRDEAEMQMLIAPLRDAATEAATSAERMFMRRLGAGCYLPVAAHGEIRGESLTLKGLVISRDGQEKVRVSRSMPWTAETDPENAGRLGVQLAEEALARGAAEIINALSVTRIQERQHA